MSWHASSLKEWPTIKALFSSCHAGMKCKVQSDVKKATSQSLDIQTVVSLSGEGWLEQIRRVTDVQEEKLDVLGQGFSNCESRLWWWELKGRLGGRDVRWGCYMRWKGNFHSQSSEYNSVTYSVICPFYQHKQQLELQLETSLTEGTFLWSNLFAFLMWTLTETPYPVAAWCCTWHCCHTMADWITAHQSN